MTLTIPMPLPPSANALFKTVRGGRRARTAAYDAWREEAGYHARLALRSAGAVPAAPIKLTILLGLCDRRRDASNCIKPIEDLLVDAIEGMPDDRWNDEVRVKRDAVVPAGTALVIVESLAPTAPT